MSRWILKFVLVFLTVWLPVQTFAVAISPLCDPLQHSRQTAVSASEIGEQQDHFHQHQDGSSRHSNSSCDKCTLCAICSFAAVVSPLPAKTEKAPTSFVGTDSSAFSSVYLDYPQRPPLASYI